MNQREVDFLRRLIADCATERKLGALAGHMASEERIGTIKGGKVLYATQDLNKARNLLLSRGYDLQAPSSAFTRSSAPRGSSEKTGALRVTEGMVAGVPIDMPQIQIPIGSLLALSSGAAMALDFDVLLVCENLEPLLQNHTYSWLGDFIKGRATLALFRGAPGYFRTDVAANFIRQDVRPTLAFFDFDPKGLSMAASLARREAMCTPPWPRLEQAIMENRRSNLYEQSVHECRPHLDRPGHDPSITQAWQRLKGLGHGLDQEHFPR